MALTILLSPVTDKKGITLEMAHDSEEDVQIIKVYRKSPIMGAPMTVKSFKFPANRWGVALPDQVRAFEKAERMARELERELGL